MAGNWLFSGHRWLDPSDQDSLTKLQREYSTLCSLCPAFAAACPASRFIAAVADVTESWRPHAALRIAGIAGSMSIADFGPPAQHRNISCSPSSDEACATTLVGAMEPIECCQPEDRQAHIAGSSGPGKMRTGPVPTALTDAWTSRGQVSPRGCSRALAAAPAPLCPHAHSTLQRAHPAASQRSRLLRRRIAAFLRAFACVEPASWLAGPRRRGGRAGRLLYRRRHGERGRRVRLDRWRWPGTGGRGAGASVGVGGGGGLWRRRGSRHAGPDLRGLGPGREWSVERWTRLRPNRTALTA